MNYKLAWDWSKELKRIIEKHVMRGPLLHDLQALADEMYKQGDQAHDEYIRKSGRSGYPWD